MDLTFSCKALVIHFKLCSGKITLKSLDIYVPAAILVYSITEYNVILEQDGFIVFICGNFLLIETTFKSGTVKSAPENRLVAPFGFD